MKEITIYYSSSFMGNIVKQEAKLLDHGRRQYAQYPAAPFVDFIPRGKRKAVRLQKSYKPYLIIIEGWNGPDPDPMCPPEGGRSKYSSFDERWKSDFNEVLKNSNVKIVADYRD